MNYSEGMVSIITPCYNSGEFVGRLLESVLTQTYPMVEMIAVDDDSSDDTASVINSYMPKFKARGYSLSYIHQPHGGQSAAINNALKMVSGEYLVWPDSDDYYSSPESLGKLVCVLKDTPDDIAMSRCLPIYVDEQKRELPPGNGVPRYLNTDKEHLFKDAIWGHNGFWYLSGGYMVKTRILDECIPEREIAHAQNAGQSWQLLLPIMYRHRCVTVRERLHTVMVRKNSHSRNFFNDYKSVMQKHRDFEYVLLKTIENIAGMPAEERDRLIREVTHHYSRQYTLTALRFRFHIPPKAWNKLMRIKDRYDSFRKQI